MEKAVYTLVWACAWCPKTTWPVLKEGEVWTHGICKTHLDVLRKTTLKKNKDPGTTLTQTTTEGAVVAETQLILKAT